MPAIVRRWGPIAVLAGIASLATLKFLPAPFVWIAGIWTIGGIIALILAPRTVWKFGALLATAVVVAVGLAETFLWIRPIEGKPKREATPRYNEPDSVLGWRLKAGVVSRELERSRGKLLYSVTYTMDAAGHRLAPRDDGPRAQGCVLFFVCSYTFGQGVEDTEAMPYRVGVRGAGRYRIVNFGAPGYGAEHMMAALDHGLVARTTPCAPTQIIYQALPHHILRAAGKLEYSRLGPRYALGPAGQLQGGTPARDPDSSLSHRLALEIGEQLRKSRLYSALTSRDPSATWGDFTLYLALVRRSRELSAKQFPNVPFHVLLWSQQVDWAERLPLRDSMLAITPDVHLVDNILPEYRAHPERYMIDARDAHPNASAHDQIAAFVVDSILAPASRAASAPKPGSARRASR